MESLDLAELCKLKPKEASKLIRDRFPAEDPNRLRTVKAIPNEDFRFAVANLVFGEKAAGDLGARSTQSHPRTNYGIPSYSGTYDAGEK